MQGDRVLVRTKESKYQEELDVDWRSLVYTLHGGDKKP
jgi:hypothetical protein